MVEMGLVPLVPSACVVDEHISKARRGVRNDRLASTASGGPFRTWTSSAHTEVTDDTIKH